MLTEKQRTIISYCHAHDGKITKKEAMTLIDDHYYNGDKHVGEVLSRMVKAGLLIRVKPGHFTIGKGTKQRPATVDNNQVEMF